MPYSLPEKQVQQLSAWIAAYSVDQRTAFHRKAAPIGEEHQKQLAGFFPADVLNKVPIVRGRAPQPPFYPRLRELGIRNAPPFSQMAGITFQDVVVHVGPLTLPL
jgi:hypothetical protein